MDDIPFSSGMVGLAGTNPALPVHHELRAAVRRRQTTPGRGFEREGPGVAPMSQLDLRNHVFNTIHQRMEKALVPNMSMVNQPFLSFLLPLKNASRAMWEHLIAEPLTLPDVDLENMFKLRKCTVEYKKNWQVGQVILYIRSFTYEVQQLNAVIDHIQSNGILLEKVDKWRAVTKNLSPTDSIFLRYCGCTSSSAWERHHEDIFNTKSSGAFFHVLHTTKLLYPEIIDEVNIYEFVTGTIPVSLPGCNKVRDSREQGVIGLFGLETLLNTQTGGKHPSTDPSSEVEQELVSLRLSTLTRMCRQTESCSASVVNDIEKYIDRVQIYANDNPESTGTNAWAFTDERCQILRRQLKPRTLKGTSYTPMTFLGHDAGVHEFRCGLPFYENDSFFKESLLAVIASFCRAEEGNDAGLTKKLFSQGFFPLVDLYQWCRKSPQDLPSAIAQTRQYLQATDPLLVVTLGHQASSVASGNFRHSHGLKQGDLSNVVGKPIIRHYSEPGSSEDVHDRSCVIVVPCYHPSVPVYAGLQGPNFVEVFARTLIIAWTVLFFALKLPQNDQPKHEFLRQVLKSTDRLVGETTDFFTTFTAALARLRAQLQSKNRSSSKKTTKQRTSSTVFSTNVKDSDRLWGKSVERRSYEKLNLDTGGDPAVLAKTERWDAARQEIEMIMLCGWALHPPHSLEANIQSRTLAGKRLATLLTDKTGHKTQSLLRWARTVAQGRYFYLEATDLSDRILDVPNLLAIFGPASADPQDSDWMEDEESLIAASKALESWLNEKVRKSTTTLDNAVVRGHEALASLIFLKDPDLLVVQRVLMEREIKRAPKVYSDNTKSLEGCEVDIVPWVNVKSSATLKLQWADNEGTMWKLTGHSRNNTEIALPPQCMSTSRSDTRHIHFVEEGIDIRTSDGVTLKSDASSCTLPLGHIRLMLKGQLCDKFLELWSRETGLNADDAEFAVPASRSQHTTATTTGQYYPAEAFSPPAGSRNNQELNVGSRGYQITAKSEEKKIRNYLPLQAGDAMWLLHKFLQEQYPGVCKLDAGNPNVIPGTDSVWTRLISFVNTPKYARHPMRQHLIDIATLALSPTNTAGCDQMLKLAIEKFLRPGTTSKRARVYVAPKQKWKVVYDLSANPPSSSTLPASVDPQLQHDQILEEADNDDVTVGHDGELIMPEQETHDDRVYQSVLDLISDQGVGEGAPSRHVAPSSGVYPQISRISHAQQPVVSSADTPIDHVDTQPVVRQSEPPSTMTQPLSQHVTIEVPRTSSPEVPDEDILQRKRDRDEFESESDDGEGDEEWVASKRQRRD